MSDPKLFYSAHVFCCTNRRPDGHKRGSCAARGSEQLRINSAGCLERCELGPTMVIYPEGVWYTYQTKEDIDEILQTHVVGGGRVERLMLQPDQTEPRSVSPA